MSKFNCSGSGSSSHSDSTPISRAPSNVTFYLTKAPTGRRLSGQHMYYTYIVYTFKHQASNQTVHMSKKQEPIKRSPCV